MPTNPGRFAVFITLLGSFCFIVQDSAMKWLSDDLAVLQTIFVRSLFALGFLVLWAVVTRTPLSLKSSRPGLVMARTLLNILSWVFFFTGLKYLPLATATALFFSFPIYLTAMSIIFLGEQVGIRRWVAMLIGFCGVILMTRPGSDFHWGALFMLGAAMGWASVAILTRKLADTKYDSKMAEQPANQEMNEASILLHTLLGFCITLALVQPWVWQPISQINWWLLVVAGFFGVIAQGALVKAYSIASPSLVAPIEYSGLVWAAIFGFVLWQDVPDGMSVMGAILIVASNIYILKREALAQAP